MKEKEIKNKGEIIIYQTSKKEVNFEVRLEKESIWLTQAQIAELFDIDRSVVTKHLGNIFKTGELEEKSNVQKMHIANSDKPREPEQLAATEDSSVVRQESLFAHGVEAGGLLKARELFGKDLNNIINELNGYLIV